MNKKKKLHVINLNKQGIKQKNVTKTRQSKLPIKMDLTLTLTLTLTQKRANLP